MRETTNKQEPSSTEGGQVKAGDTVWVKCKVIDPCESLMKVTGSGDENWFWAGRGQCRPVEPSPKEPTPGQKLAERTMKAIWAANDAVSGTPVKEPAAKKYREPTLVDLKNGPIDCEVRDYHDEPWKSGVLVCVHNSRAWRFQAQPQTRSYVYAPHWNQCRIAVPVEPIPEPATKESLATEPNSSEIPDSSSDPLAVGDAVRFVSPGHNRHGTEGTLKSIHHGPTNAYLFVSNCGQFHRYCTIAELEHYNQADPVDIKGSMQSLDGADTIQAGDLQWTDRDGKYRLCNFTIGMRVHDAIQRGKAHGEKWVFYRKFREVGE
jgi:hypothetical protein